MGEFQYEEETVGNIDFIQSEFAHLHHQIEALKAILARVALCADTLIDTSTGSEGLIPVPEWVRMKPTVEDELDYLVGLDDLFPALSPFAGPLLLPPSHASISPMVSPWGPDSSLQPSSRLAFCPPSLDDDSILVSPRLASCPRTNSLLVSPCASDSALQSSPRLASYPVATPLSQSSLRASAPLTSLHLAAACSATTPLSVFPLSRRISSTILAKALAAELQKPRKATGVRVTSALLARRLSEAGRPTEVFRLTQAPQKLLSYNLRLAMALDASLYEYLYV